MTPWPIAHAPCQTKIVIPSVARDLSSSLGKLPELLAGYRGTLRQGLELGPGDVAVDAAAQSAIGRGDHPLLAYQLGKSPDTLGDQLGMLDDVGGVTDHARQDQPIV